MTRSRAKSKRKSKLVPIAKARPLLKAWQVATAFAVFAGLAILTGVYQEIGKIALTEAPRLFAGKPEPQLASALPPPPTMPPVQPLELPAPDSIQAVSGALPPVQPYDLPPPSLVASKVAQPEASTSSSVVVAPRLSNETPRDIRPGAATLSAGTATQRSIPNQVARVGSDGMYSGAFYDDTVRSVSIYPDTVRSVSIYPDTVRSVSLYPQIARNGGADGDGGGDGVGAGDGGDGGGGDGGGCCGGAAGTYGGSTYGFTPDDGQSGFNRWAP